MSKEKIVALSHQLVEVAMKADLHWGDVIEALGVSAKVVSTTAAIMNKDDAAEFHALAVGHLQRGFKRKIEVDLREAKMH